MRNFFNALLGKKSPEFFEVIKGRKSVKYFDADVKIKREEIIEMLDEANIAPSSCNLTLEIYRCRYSGRKREVREC